MRINCLAIDDEPFALKQIADYINKTPFLELTGKCFNALEAMEIMASNRIDLIFIDINMPEMSGMDFIKTLPPGTNFIFTTAYSQYAVESYKVDAIDYLLKPISYEDFLRAATKAQKHLVEKFNKSTEKDKDINDYFFVNSEGKTIKINFQDIDFIESISEYVKIHLSDRSHVITLTRLKNLENFLPAEKFMRVHRSYIVNLKNITTIERNRIVYYGNIYVPVSEQYKIDFKKFIDKNFMLC